MVSKSYSAVLPVIEASTDIQDPGVFSVPFSISELKHKHGKTESKTRQLSLSLLLMELFQTKSAGTTIKHALFY